MKAPDIGSVKHVKAAVIRNGVQRAFASRLSRRAGDIRYAVIVSPWITSLKAEKYSVENLAKQVRRRRLPLYIFTRPPATPEHLDAINEFMTCPTVEIVYNKYLHAKVYACVGPYPGGFAIVGSANMTAGSAELHEIGLLVLASGGGNQIIAELANFGLGYIRTQPESRVVKKRMPALRS